MRQIVHCEPLGDGPASYSDLRGDVDEGLDCGMHLLGADKQSLT